MSAKREPGGSTIFATTGNVQLFFGEYICVTEEAINLVYGAPVGEDMVCFNPSCGEETHKTGDMAFPDVDTIFIRAGDAPTKHFDSEDNLLGA